MKSFFRVWLPYLACLAVLLGAMSWISVAVLRLDRAEVEARRRAVLEENVRLALWRMDSLLAPVVAQESARPYFVYRTFVPASRAFGQMFRDGGNSSEQLLPSPLLGAAPPQIRVHFQYEPDGRLVAPQVPQADERGLAVPAYLAESTVAAAGERLAEVGRWVRREELAARLPTPAPVDARWLARPVEIPPNAMANTARLDESARQARGAVEFAMRNQAMVLNRDAATQSQMPSLENRVLVETDVRGTPMTPLWIGGRMLLARRVVVAGREYIQGCLLDWPAMRRELLATVADLLPHADLTPHPGNATGREAYLLAALPVRLIPGEPPWEDDSPWSPARLSLVVAWGGVGLVAAAVAVLLAGVVALSERRAAFVSAVTHELRTPLTTFHMYTEMLAEGMVSDPAQQQTYLATLRNEAARLTHLVENVLAYARLERGRSPGKRDAIPVAELLQGSRERLAERARQAEMELVVEADEAALSAVVLANPSAVDQILFNLVENACKYAAGAADRRVHLSVEVLRRQVKLRVRDHGPGIARAAAWRLFRGFTKSAQEAAESAPGIGLGLALSRRLARSQNGRLECDAGVSGGACLVLTLQRMPPDAAADP